MGAISFWYFWTIWFRKKLKNLILKNSEISGLAQNYLRHFLNNFANSCAHLFANFQNFSKHPQHLLFDGFEGSYGQKTKRIRHWKICHFKPTLKFNFFCGWDFSTFLLIIWFKSTKMKLCPYFTTELVHKLMKKT